MEKDILQMKNIEKSFPGVKALDKVNLNLKKGEIHGLIGENGAGKSTLMKILLGIYHPDKGEIFLNGKKVNIDSPHTAIKHGITLVPQELNLIPELSVTENIFLEEKPKQNIFGLIDWKTAKKKAKKQLEVMNTFLDIDKKAKDLSTSEQQIVSIARCLIFGFDILLLDEPTASLSKEETEILFKIMRDIRQEGKTIVFISHFLEEIKQITDRVTILRDGEFIKEDNTSNLSIKNMIYYMTDREFEKIPIERKTEISEEAFLEVRDLNVEDELKDISFDVKKSEILGVAGLVGAGRTELFKTIYGLIKKTSGQILIDGSEVNIKNPSIAQKHGIAYVPEERKSEGIIPLLSVSENMTLPIYKNKSKFGLINYREIEETVNHYIDEIGIKTPSSETKIKNLSGGNQQKAILARAMALDLKLLILDEPTRGIDIQAKDEIHKIIGNLADSGITVIVISSEEEELYAVSDRIMVMHEGKVKGFIKNDKQKSDLHKDVLEMAFDESEKNK